MIIEALARWTELKPGKINPNNDDEINRLINGEIHEEGEESYSAALEVSYEYSPIVFNLRDVVRFNRSHDKDHVTLRFKDGEGQVIKFPYESWIKMYSELTGMAINSIVPEDWFKRNESAGDDEPMNGDSDEDEDDFNDI
jgi:hypothetical protein